MTGAYQSMNNYGNMAAGGGDGSGQRASCSGCRVLMKAAVKKMEQNRTTFVRHFLAANHLAPKRNASHHATTKLNWTNPEIPFN
jgi:hypothetical protein